MLPTRRRKASGGVICVSGVLRVAIEPAVKGAVTFIDVRIALDVIRLAHRREYDVAIVFSQDQDLSEAALEIRAISAEQDRWIKIACAFPLSPTSRNRRGIDRTDWIPLDRATYDACIDRRDYRPRIPAT